ncbi:MAG: hypothetical protein JST35_09880 [Armatimonadetes bacterium]|nr:hypothetical protein [Armatimonadota bacterium]
MVTCSCGKSIDKLPKWLEGVKVEFVCNNCPNRQTKNIAFLQLENIVGEKPKSEEDEMEAIDEPEEEE